VEVLPTGDVSDWMRQVELLQAEIVARHGLFPDSTPDIVADRAR
jgi:hypothetical protein